MNPAGFPVSTAGSTAANNCEPQPYTSSGACALPWVQKVSDARSAISTQISPMISPGHLQSQAFVGEANNTVAIGNIIADIKEDGCSHSLQIMIHNAPDWSCCTMLELVL